VDLLRGIILVQSVSVVGLDDLTVEVEVRLDHALIG
jgi:hypothetical protein